MSHRERRRRVRPVFHFCAARQDRKARFQYQSHIRLEQIRARQLKGTVPFCPPVAIRPVLAYQESLAAYGSG